MKPFNELMVNTTFLITGGNLGLRTEHLHAAATAIAKTCGTLVKASGIYETKAWGFANQPDFYNQVLCIHTHLTAQELLDEILSIEMKMGRERLIKLGPRIIDIDILFFNDDIIETNSLKVPHPHIAERRFVLEPLCEIAHGLIHPVYNKSIAAMLEECTDELPVYKI